MPSKNGDAVVANLEALAAQLKNIERKALRAAAAVVKERLIEATPVRVSEEQGGNALAPGALKAAVRMRVNVGDGTPENPSTTTVDFGKLSYVANFVDRGHRPPHARSLSRAGLTSSGKNTPAHPFVRAVEDSSAQTAQDAYTETLQAEIEKVLRGR